VTLAAAAVAEVILVFDMLDRRDPLLVGESDPRPLPATDIVDPVELHEFCRLLRLDGGHVAAGDVFTEHGEAPGLPLAGPRGTVPLGVLLHARLDILGLANVVLAVLKLEAVDCLA
jgi:hypothetical protein